MRKILYSLILLLCTTAASASAETAIEARADFENSRIVVEGTTSPSSEIPVMLFKDYGTELLTPMNIEAFAEHVTSAVSDENGSLSEISLTMVPAGSWFKLFAGDMALSDEGIKVYYPTQAEFDAAKLAINGATEQTMESVLATHGKALGVDMSCREYTYCTREFCEALALKKPLGGWTYISDEAQSVTFQKDFEAVKGVFNRYVEALDSINGATRETLTAVLGNYNDMLGLTLSGKYATYSSEINRSLATVQYESLEAFKTAFNNAVISYTPPKSQISGGSGVTGNSGDVTVEVTKPADYAKSEPFTDISTVEWAEESILKLSEKGIVAGVGNGLFDPDGNVTREQFVKMIILSLELPVAAEGAAFSDVEQTAWYSQYVMAAYRLEIVTGKDDGSFGIGESITREDMAVMVLRAVNAAGAKLKQGELVSYIDESDFSAYAAENIKELGRAGIITGMPDGKFMPKSYSTRAQAAVVLDRLIENVRG